MTRLATKTCLSSYTVYTYELLPHKTVANIWIVIQSRWRYLQKVETAIPGSNWKLEVISYINYMLWKESMIQKEPQIIDNRFLALQSEQIMDHRDRLLDRCVIGKSGNVIVYACYIYLCLKHYVIRLTQSSTQFWAYWKLDDNSF